MAAYRRSAVSCYGFCSIDSWTDSKAGCFSPCKDSYPLYASHIAPFTRYQVQPPYHHSVCPVFLHWQKDYQAGKRIRPLVDLTGKDTVLRVPKPWQKPGKKPGDMKKFIRQVSYLADLGYREGWAQEEDYLQKERQAEQQELEAAEQISSSSSSEDDDSTTQPLTPLY